MIQLNFENLNEIEKLMDPRAVERALASTIGRVTTKTRTFVNRDVRRVYNVKAALINENTRIQKIQIDGGPGRLIEWKSKRLGLEQFAIGSRTVRVRVQQHKRATPSGGQTTVKGFRSRRKAVTARIRKDAPRKIVKGAFLGRDGKLAFERFSDKHDKIRRVVRLSVAQMVNDDVLNRAAEFIRKESNVELDRNLRFQISKGA